MPQKTKHTPMMEQYLKIKEQYPDAFLFYRLGDFYELFNEDALKAAKLLEITLTSRNKNADDPIPMCGVPYHAAEDYIRTLIKGGYKVAVCEQMEDPKQTKGMVKREVVQVLTPGTYMEEKGDESRNNNYLAAVKQAGSLFSLAYTDIGTGELRVTLLGSEEAVVNEIQALQAKEVIMEEKENIASVDRLAERTGMVLSRYKKEADLDQPPHLLEDISEKSCQAVLDLLLGYLAATQMKSLSHLQKAVRYESDQYLKMDTFARRNLELTASLRNQKKTGSLLWLMDQTKTAMGGRKLKQWLEKPLIAQTEIEERQDKVETLLNHYFERMDIAEALSSVYDLERLVAKLSMGNINGRDLIQLKTSLHQLPALAAAIDMMEEPVWEQTLLELVEIPQLAQLIEQAIIDDPPIQIKEGNIIKDGYNAELDQYRDAMRNGKKWIAALQQQEREKTGIKSLKIGYNRVFGYYIEVSKANIPLLPEGLYDRKQTLANAERFITPELKEKERIILEAEEKSAVLEYELFMSVREEIKKYSSRLQKTAKIISEIDVLQSFAEISERYHYVKPVVSAETKTIRIHGGRHPVVEEVLGKENFVANHLTMEEKDSILLITGPNMSGKSTYMRQLALIAIMAQMGCYVPAESAELPIFDQIFTRIGAADDLYSGQSTFMVEMVETNQALQYATERSLILFDEIGRGTATFDGMALAEAILRHLHTFEKGKVLFSTHYHELTALQQELASLKNVHVGAVEKNGELVFLHQIMDGPADKSYGLHVAKLAGMPDSLLEEADRILKRLEGGRTGTAAVQKNAPVQQIALFEEDAWNQNERAIVQELKEMVLEKQTPIDLMVTVQNWKKKLEEADGR